MKQFVREFGDQQMSVEESELIKQDILRAVYLRTKLILKHLLYSSTIRDPREMNLLENAYDELADAEDEANRKFSGNGAESEDAFCPTPTYERASTLLRLLEWVWGNTHMKAANSNDGLIAKLRGNISSRQTEQLFLSGGYFAHKVVAVMDVTYVLTHEDWCHTRTWTRECSEHQLAGSENVGRFMIRDIGGDEMNKHHWNTALAESFCSLFVVSLTDYTTVAKDGEAQFQEIRRSLWQLIDQKVHGQRPQVVVLLNKQDLFRDMISTQPLHTHCKIFSAVGGQLDGESTEEYGVRCEEQVANYFATMPQEMEEKYHWSSGDKPPSIASAHFLSAINEETFKSTLQSLALPANGSRTNPGRIFD